LDNQKSNRMPSLGEQAEPSGFEGSHLTRWKLYALHDACATGFAGLRCGRFLRRPCWLAARRWGLSAPASRPQTAAIDGTGKTKAKVITGIGADNILSEPRRH
jgi:hypothetical protein